MEWNIEFTDQFEAWWRELAAPVQDDIDVSVFMLGSKGPALGFPYSSDIKGSRHGHLRELRVQSGGQPFRILYAFDPRRTAILLLGGLKTGDDRWYDKYVPMADDLYDSHLRELKTEGLL